MPLYNRITGTPTLPPRKEGLLSKSDAGTLYTLGGTQGVYIVAQVSVNQIRLISLRDGNRWSDDNHLPVDAVQIKSPITLTPPSV